MTLTVTELSGQAEELGRARRLRPTRLGFAHTRAIGEARLVSSEHGLRPESDGWFVMSAHEAEWQHSERHGSVCGFEGYEPFAELGVSLNVLHPGQPKGLYHAENAQEDFLVLAGECVLIVEGQERTLRQWDLFHCPAWTEHVVVGAGNGPCVLLAVGSRVQPLEIRFPVNDTALRRGAGTTEELTSSRDVWPLLGFHDGAYHPGNLP
jgi:uncharacterized cupin superfamily protein